jgi:argininosuccinate lyase
MVNPTKPHDTTAMNDHQRAEEIMAERLIERTKMYAGMLVATGIIDHEDAEPAALAAMLKAVEVYAKEVGLDPDRVLVRPE